MTAEGNSSLKKKVEAEFSEDSINVKRLVRTLIRSFLRSESNYGAITEIKSNMNSIYQMAMNFIDEEKMDIYALKIDDRILLSKTDVDFEDVYAVIRNHSILHIKKDMIEIWDDQNVKVLHLIVVPVRKHFPIEYSALKQKTKLIEKISSMTWHIAPP